MYSAVRTQSSAYIQSAMLQKKGNLEDKFWYFCTIFFLSFCRRRHKMTRRGVDMSLSHTSVSQELWNHKLSSFWSSVQMILKGLSTQFMPSGFLYLILSTSCFFCEENRGGMTFGFPWYVVHSSAPSDSYSFMSIFLKLYRYFCRALKTCMWFTSIWNYRYFCHALKMCMWFRSFWNCTGVYVMLCTFMWFRYNPHIDFCLYFSAFWTSFFWVQILSKLSNGFLVSSAPSNSVYLVSITAPTVLYQSFWNCTGIFVML